MHGAPSRDEKAGEAGRWTVRAAKMQGKPPEGQNQRLQCLGPIEQPSVMPDCAKNHHQQPFDPGHVAWSARLEWPREFPLSLLRFDALQPLRELPPDGQVCSKVHQTAEILLLDVAFEEAALSGATKAIWQRCSSHPRRAWLGPVIDVAQRASLPDNAGVRTRL